MKRVFIISAGTKHSQEEEYAAWALDQGVSPFVAGRFYRDCKPEVLVSWLQAAYEAWVFVVDGIVTAGVRNLASAAIASDVHLRWHAVQLHPYERPTIAALPHLPTDSIPDRADLMLPASFADTVTVELADVAAKLRAGEAIDDAALDKLLGTGLQERDRECEALWENGRRAK